jgi:hypothetical protein
MKHEENVAPSKFPLVDHANFKALLLAMAVFGSKPNLTTTMQELLEPILVSDRQI